jgi:hypothetical protein
MAEQLCPTGGQETAFAAAAVDNAAAKQARMRAGMLGAPHGRSIMGPGVIRRSTKCQPIR